MLQLLLLPVPADPLHHLPSYLRHLLCRLVSISLLVCLLLQHCCWLRLSICVILRNALQSFNDLLRSYFNGRLTAAGAQIAACSNLSQAPLAAATSAVFV